MHLRKMTINDIPSIKGIGDAAPELSVTEGNSLFWGEKRLADWISADQDIMLVAEINHKVVGFQITNISSSSKIGYLSDLAVDENFRGNGVGSALTKQTLSIMKEQGITYVYALTQPKNTNIHSLLRKHGFEQGEQMVWYDKHI
jgi:ribosomal protein S18 acetylase RimI-like enzyme